MSKKSKQKGQGLPELLLPTNDVQNQTKESDILPEILDDAMQTRIGGFGFITGGMSGVIAAGATVLITSYMLGIEVTNASPLLAKWATVVAVGIPSYFAATRGAIAGALSTTPEGRKYIKNFISEKFSNVKNLFLGKSKDKEPLPVAWEATTITRDASQDTSKEAARVNVDASINALPKKNIKDINEQGFCVNIVSQEEHGESAPNKLISYFDRAKDIVKRNEPQVLQIGFKENPALQNGSSLIQAMQDGVVAISPSKPSSQTSVDICVLVQKDLKSIELIDIDIDRSNLNVTRLENLGETTIPNSIMPEGDQIFSAKVCPEGNLVLGTQKGRVIHLTKTDSKTLSDQNIIVSASKISDHPVTIKDFESEGLSSLITANSNGKEHSLFVKNGSLDSIEQEKRGFPSDLKTPPQRKDVVEKLVPPPPPSAAPRYPQPPKKILE